MPDVIYDTNGKLSVGSYHMWRLYPTRITTRSTESSQLQTVLLISEFHTDMPKRYNLRSSYSLSPWWSESIFVIAQLVLTLESPEQGNLNCFKEI